MGKATHSFQEFRCNKCPGFFVVRLNTAIQGKVLLVCPKCGRKHQRDVIKGIIVDVGKQSDESKIPEIMVPKAAFSKQAKTKLLENANRTLYTYDPRNRDGAPINSASDLVDPLDFTLYGG